MRFVTLSLLLLIMTTTAQAKMTVGIDGSTPPFSYRLPSGELKGFDVDYAKALCKIIGEECVLLPMDWDGIIPSIAQGKVDFVVASMAITEERKKHVLFTIPYERAPVGQFVKAKSNFSNYEQLTDGYAKGKVTIGVLSSSVHLNYLVRHFGEAASKNLKMYTSQGDAFQDLASGRLDAFFGEPMIISYDLFQSPNGKEFDFVGPQHLDPQIFGSNGTGIVLRLENTALAERLNNAILKSAADGTHESIAETYFGKGIHLYPDSSR